MEGGEINEKITSCSEGPCPILGMRRDLRKENGACCVKGICLGCLGGCRTWTPVPSLAWCSGFNVEVGLP